MAVSCSLIVSSGSFLQGVYVAQKVVLTSPPSSHIKHRPRAVFEKHGRITSRAAFLVVDKPRISPLPGPLPKSCPLALPGMRLRLLAAKVRGVRADSLEVTGAQVGGGANLILEQGCLASERLPARDVKGSPSSSGPVKSCLECHRSKLLVDFKRTVTSPDGRVDVCRACLAALQAKRLDKELYHLGLSVEESWENGKECQRCGHFKECRDFARNRTWEDELEVSCRSCRSEERLRCVEKGPVDRQVCSKCKEVKAATAFDLQKKSSSGLQGACRECAKEYKKHLKSKGYLKVPRREERICTICGKAKRTSDFHRDPHRLDGLCFQCIECSLQYSRKRIAARRKRAAEGKGLVEGLSNPHHHRIQVLGPLRISE